MAGAALPGRLNWRLAELVPGNAEFEPAPPGDRSLVLGAGAVLRCSHCEHMLARIVEDAERVWLGVAGMRTLEIAAYQTAPST